MVIDGNNSINHNKNYEMYILRVCYDSNNGGFQSQKDGSGICDIIMDTLISLDYTDSKKIIYYGGRTDKGVSSIGNFIVVNLKKEPILSHIYSKIKDNGIWIVGYKKINQIPKVKYRHYRYILYNDNYNIEKIKEGAKLLIGTHSFHNLSKKDRSKNKSPIRTIYDIKIKHNDFYITIDIFGESFLWNMVRKIITVLTYLGEGKKDIDYIKKLLDTNYKEGVPNAPPEGLILMDAKTDIEYTYDNYVLRKFKEEWKKRLINNTLSLGVSKSIVDYKFK